MPRTPGAVGLHDLLNPHPVSRDAAQPVMSTLAGL